MNLQDHLQQDRIFYLKEQRKIQAIRELVEHTCALVPVLEYGQTLQAVEERESVVSSWVAPGIAIPHARLPNLEDFIISIGISRDGIEYESGDGQPVYLLVLILGAVRRAEQHILLLAEVARTFRSESIRRAVWSAPSAPEVFRILQNPQTLTQRIGPVGTAGISEFILAHALDDVTDFIHAAADAMFIYKADRPGQKAKELSEIIVQAAVEVEKALPELRRRSSLKHILEHCVEINRLENTADRVFRSAMADLFTDTTDITEIIKWREIYEHMESATDRCEDVADVLEGVALKHA